MVALIGSVGGWYVIDHPTGETPSAIADGPTFYQAFAAVNRSIASLPGGPWTVYAVWGVATPIPLSPNSIGWVSENRTVNNCSAQFNGLTLWNGSIPLFNGTFNSGTAPFWQFAFSSNNSQSVEIATDVLGVARAYTPIPYSSPCIEWSALSQTPWRWAQILSPFPSDTPALAESAWNLFGSAWTSWNPPSFEAFVFGFSYWGSANPMGLIVKYSRCGLVGATAIQPVAYIDGRSDGTTSGYFNGTQGCGNVASLDPPVLVPYTVQFTGLTVRQSNETRWYNVTQTVGYYGQNDTDASGLNTWMTRFNLTNGTAMALPASPPVCSGWVAQVAACAADSSGWYLVLTSATGEWLDAYGESSNGPAWMIPNVALVSQQHLTVVAPSTWNLTGATLTLASTTAEGPASGSVTL